MPPLQNTTTNFTLFDVVTVNESYLYSNYEQICPKFPKNFSSFMWILIFVNAIIAFTVNLLIFFSYLFSRNYKKLTVTEYYITFLSLIDLIFSGSIIFMGINDKILPDAFVNSCVFFRTVAITHAFQQFLSWLLYFNITLERYLSICKVSFILNSYDRKEKTATIYQNDKIKYFKIDKRSS